MKTHISGVLMIVFAQSAFGADFCVHPSGNAAWPTCQTSNGQCSPSGACSLSTANNALVAGDRALLMGGAYTDKIAPRHNGNSDSARITYQAYDETEVVLRNCSGSAAAQGQGGAINLDLREWISVIGRPPGNPVGTQRIRVDPNSRCATGFSACGARFGILSDIKVESCPGEFEYRGGVNPACANRSIGRLGNYCMAAFDQTAWARSTEYFLTQNSQFIGNLDGSKNCSSCTYDNIVAERGNRYLVFRNNLFDSAVHANLKLSDARGWGHAIIGNRLRAYWHTGMTLYQSGKHNADRNRTDFLLEGNYVTATWETPGLPHSNPGNGLQIGGGPLLRYNVIGESNNKLQQSSAHGTISSSFGESSSTENSCGGIYAYHNSVVNSGGSSVRCNTPNWSPGTSDQSQYGLSYFNSNIFYDAFNVKNNRMFNYGNPQNPSIALLDRFINTKVERPGSSDYNGVYHSMGAGSSMANARANYDGTDASRPIVSDWEGFRNEYVPGLGAWFRDYAAKDYGLANSSPGIDAGAPLTRIAASDSGSGATIIVEHPRVLWGSCSAYAAHPWMGIACEEICIGSDRDDIATATCGAQVTDVDYASGAVTLNMPVNRAVGDYLWVYKDSQGVQRIYGQTSDIGAHETLASSPPPANVRPVIREVVPVPSPTNSFSNTWTFEIIDPDSNQFDLQWYGPCAGPLLASGVGTHVDFVSVPDYGVYDQCSVTANDGQLDSHILTLSAFEVLEPGGAVTAPTITSMIPSGDLPKGTRETDIVITTDIDSNCRFAPGHDDWNWLVPFAQRHTTRFEHEIGVQPGLVQWYGIQCESSVTGNRSAVKKLYIYAPK